LETVSFMVLIKFPYRLWRMSRGRRVSNAALNTLYAYVPHLISRIPLVYSRDEL
jgi:hypothetical protein